MKSGLFILLCAVCLPSWTAEVPQEEKAKIAVFLWHDSPNDVEALAGLKRGLAVMNLEISKEIHADQDEALARRLLLGLKEEKIDLVVAFGTRSAQMARAILPETRIVFSAVTNPILSGLAPSWKGSGGLLAGNSNWLDRGHMLDVFSQAVPGMRRLAIVRSPENAVSRAELEEARAALASRPGLELVDLILETPEAMATRLPELLGEIDAVWLPIDFDLYQPEPLARLIAICNERKIPVVASISRAADAGALVTLTVDYRQLGLKAASLVRRVLSGEKIGEIPIGRLTATRLHVDLAAARRLGVDLPIDLLLDAHEIHGGAEKP